MNNDVILASISKIHAYRYAKEKQRGVKFGENQVTTTATKFTTAPIQIGTGDFSVEFYGNSYGSDASTGYSFIRYLSGSLSSGNAFNVLANKGENGISIFQFGDTNLSPISYSNPDLNGLFHFIVTRSGTNVKVVVNNKIIGEYATTKICDFSTINFLIANSRYVGLFRIWKYALSADEIATLYNNGDPMGYVVPKLYRQFGPDIEPVAETFEFNIDSTYSQIVLANRQYPFDCMYRVNYVVEEWNFEPEVYNKVGFGVTSGGSIISGVSNWRSLEEANVGQMQSMIIKFVDTGYPSLLIYGDQRYDITTSRRLKVTIKGITPVGLLAEYLPHNLIATKKGPQIEPLAESFEFNIGDEYYKGVVLQQKYPYDCIYRVDYIIDEWDYQPQVYSIVGFFGIGGATTIGGASSWDTLEKAKVGETQSCFVKMPGTGSPALYIYGGNDNEEATARHLKVTIKSITPVSVASTWLDSAKQLPWSDTYLPHLLQSKGGYNMVVNGAPEVLFNE